MRPWVLSQLPEEDVRLFEEIRTIINCLPDEIQGEGMEMISCHVLARAIGRVFGLKWVDGYFYPNYQHSWLVTKNGNIIDVYPVGIFPGPLLVHGSHPPKNYFPGKWLYMKKRLFHGKTKKPAFCRFVKKIEILLRQAIAIKGVN